MSQGRSFPSVTEREFHRSVLVLADAGYVAYGVPEYDGGGGCVFTHFQVTGAGMQALGLWPMFGRARLADAAGGAPRSARA